MNASHVLINSLTKTGMRTFDSPKLMLITMPFMRWWAERGKTAIYHLVAGGGGSVVW